MSNNLNYIMPKKSCFVGFRCMPNMFKALESLSYPMMLIDFDNEYKKIRVSNKSELINYLILYAVSNKAFKEEDKIKFIKELQGEEEHADAS